MLTSSITPLINKAVDIAGKLIETPEEKKALTADLPPGSLYRTGNILKTIY